MKYIILTLLLSLSFKAEAVPPNHPLYKCQQEAFRVIKAINPWADSLDIKLLNNGTSSIKATEVSGFTSFLLKMTWNQELNRSLPAGRYIGEYIVTMNNGKAVPGRCIVSNINYLGFKSINYKKRFR